MSNFTCLGGTDVPQLFYDIVFGWGVHPKPDIFGDGRNVSVRDVCHLLEAFVHHHGYKDKDGSIDVTWAEIDAIYKGPIFARPDLVLRSRSFVPNWARYLGLLNLGGTATYGWIETMMYANHDGDIYSMKGDDWLNPEALRPSQIWSDDVHRRSGYLNARRAKDFPMQDWDEITFEMRWLFGACVKGTIDKFKAYSHTPPTRQRDEHLVGQTLFIDVACRIHAGAILKEAVQLQRVADA